MGEYEELLDDYTDKEKRIDIANDFLRQQGLIQLGEKKNVSSYSWVVVRLTMPGFDLGQKYNSTYWVIVFWCREYFKPLGRLMSLFTNN